MRLIDADALIKVIQQNDYMLTAKHNSMAPGMFTSGIRQAVDESQTIDPVKHGRWVCHPDPNKVALICSVCGQVMPFVFEYLPQEPPYCNCGAKMDGEV